MAILMFSGFTTQAATFAMSSKDICVVSLEGEIVEGDFQRLQTIGATAFKGSDGESSAKDTICLNSPGGSVAEGVRIAEFFYQKGIGTVIDQGDECYSICAIMFMMGIAQGAEVNFVNRKLHLGGKLGFHRPYLDIQSDEMISVRALAVAHDAAVESVMKIMILANNHVPWSNSTMMRPDLVQQMLNHIGNDLFYIDTVEKAGRFEIDILGMPKGSGLTQEQAYYACENSFHWQVGLMDTSADYRKLQKDLGPNNGGNSIVKLLKDDPKEKIYSVTSGDAGYSEAGCLIAHRGTYLSGCGYNGMYNVMLGQGQCNLHDFEERSQSVPPLATFKPDTPISMLGQAMATPPPQAEPSKATTAVCTVFSPTALLDRQPCSVAVNLGEIANGKRLDRYEFVWPTGNKTIISKDGDTLYINGKIARPVADAAYTFCVLNSDTGNRFCFKS
ncbi:hypothetical protein [Agrobacterium cavarae]|uniref:hypothetical protein n=1 Tax=Agrobacterium cavarae TaxID=2528239 RepID=UPI0028ADD092|nr:hypothetical protein [Agrobacterium cavarae]